MNEVNVAKIVGLKYLKSEVLKKGGARTRSGVVSRVTVSRVVRSHVDRRCSNVGPTQSHISPSALVYQDNRVPPPPFASNRIGQGRGVATSRGAASPEALTISRRERFRGGRVFKAHRLLYHSTLGWGVIKKKKKGGRYQERGGVARGLDHFEKGAGG